MYKHNWQLSNPVTAIIFDCDGTLSDLEGVNVLAEANNVGEIITKATESAMAQDGLNPELYAARLKTILPTRQQIEALGNSYIQSLTPEANTVINIFQRLQKSVYLASAGLLPAIKMMAQHLSIPAQQIYAVDIEFDTNGNYLDFDRASPLINNSGKRHIVNELKKQHMHIAHIGDGMNDIVTIDLVTRFIGYGGAYYRENIAKQCEFYIYAKTMAPLLPLLLTLAEYNLLSAAEKSIYQIGLTYLQNSSKVKPSA